MRPGCFACGRNCRRVKETGGDNGGDGSSSTVESPRTLTLQVIRCAGCSDVDSGKRGSDAGVTEYQWLRDASFHPPRGTCAEYKNDDSGRCIWISGINAAIVPWPVRIVLESFPGAGPSTGLELFLSSVCFTPGSLLHLLSFFVSDLPTDTSSSYLPVAAASLPSESTGWSLTLVPWQLYLSLSLHCLPPPHLPSLSRSFPTYLIPPPSCSRLSPKRQQTSQAHIRGNRKDGAN